MATTTTNLSKGDVYDLLQDSVVFAWVEKKDGSFSYRGLTRHPELYGRLFSGVVTAEDKGKTKRAHWTDDLTAEQIKDVIVGGEKPMYVYDAVRQGRKGISVYLTNIMTDEEYKGLPNLVVQKVDDIIEDDRFKALLEGKLDVEDYIKGEGELKPEISENQIKEVLKRLEDNVYIVSFRKSNGEPRLMVCTRNQHVVDSVSGETAYETLFAEDLRGDKYVDILVSGVIPVMDLEIQDSRVINLNNLISLEGRPPIIKVDKDLVPSYLEGIYSIKDLLEGNLEQRNMKDKGLTEDDERVNRFAMMNSYQADERWTQRLGRMHHLLTKKIKEDFAKEGEDFSKMDVKVKVLNGRVFEVKAGKDNEIYLMISPVGVYDMTTHDFEFFGRQGNKKYAHREGIKNQQKRIYNNMNVLGLKKALLLNYILNSFILNKKVKNINYFDELFLNRAKAKTKGQQRTFEKGY